MNMRCNYCGRTKTEYDDIYCEECALKFKEDYEKTLEECYSWDREKIMSTYEGDLCCDDYNNIDNILEQKRTDMKRRGTYRIG